MAFITSLFHFSKKAGGLYEEIYFYFPGARVHAYTDECRHADSKYDNFIVVSFARKGSIENLCDKITAAFQYAADNYHTYATGKTLEEARDHHVVAGISSGGNTADYYMCNYSQYAANYILLSCQMIAKAHPQLGFLYVGSGSSDHKGMTGTQEKIAKQHEADCEKFVAGTWEGGHKWVCWQYVIPEVFDQLFAFIGSKNAVIEGEKLVRAK